MVSATGARLAALAPRGVPGRWLSLPLCLPLFFFPQPLPPPGQAWFTLLDVGDGLAAVVRTRQHVLIYDTGSRLGRSSDTGRTTLIPFLRQQGLQHIDSLIISHSSAHHTGGVRSLRTAFPIDTILTGAPDQLAIAITKACDAGQHWRWDGVDIRLLHPPATAGWRAANASCVLLVQAGDHKLLLPGDLQAAGIRALLRQLAPYSPVDILLAPQHGWRPLAEQRLLTLTRPRYVLFSTAHKNRYGYPRQQTLELYAATGATLLNTASSGAIQFQLGSSVAPQARQFRPYSRRYWPTP